MSELALRNRQRVRRVNTVLLRRIVRSLLSEYLELQDYEVCIHLVGVVEMAVINRKYLQHEGSTDVITFSHSDKTGSGTALQGEIFVCVDEATVYARQFRTSWQSEIVRYVVHGILHLQGHDDVRPAARRTMKREENRLVRALARGFPFSKLEN